MLSSLIQTKMHRPMVPPDLIARERMANYLEENCHQSSLTLVSAPAGYGKSTLVSHWLENSRLKHTWLSLDEHDNDFRQLVSYVIAAVKKLFSDSCRDSESMLTISDFPEPRVVAHQLIEDLGSIGERFILVLDDFQTISDVQISDFINELLKFPVPALHLVITSRRDPAIPISLLRSKGILTEIRVQDLRFSIDESSALISNITGISLPIDELEALEKKTEGWPTGLRLIALSLRNQQNVSLALADIPDDNRFVMDYILGEVIARQSPAVQHYLLAISILDRFCASLCKEVCGEEFFHADQTDGVSFIEWLQQSNLFLIPLDSSNTWFRFHHLFRSLLTHQAKKQLSEDDVKKLHVKAGRWFAEHQHVDEALYFLLKGGDTDSAVEFFCSQRHDCMNREQWRKLDRWLAKLPQEVVDQNPELLISKAWHFDSGLQYAELVKYVGKAGEVITGLPAGLEPISKTLLSEYNALKGFLHYLNGDGQSAVRSCSSALREIEHSAYSVRGYATIILAGAYQMIGELDKAYSTIHDAFEENFEHGTTYHSRLFVSLCFTNWIAGDITGLVQTSRELKKIGYEYSLPESISFGHYFHGVSCYCQNDLESAKIEFQQIYGKPFYTNIWDYSHSAFGLGLVLMAQGRSEDAESIAEEVISLAYNKQNNDLLRLAKAFQMELALVKGDYSAVKHWTKTFESNPFRPGYRSYAPQLTLARALYCESSNESLNNALDLLFELGEYYQEIHNTRFLVEVSLLKALVFNRIDQNSEALRAFNAAVKLAEPGGILRPFFDLGMDVLHLINDLAEGSDLPAYAEKIYRGFQDSKVADQAPNEATLKNRDIREIEEQIGHLTNREIELIKLLADRLSNDEIADKLYISPETVKKHLSNIYRKLGVKNRRQAVQSVEQFGII